MLDEETDAAALFTGRELERPPEAEWPEWSGTVRAAFQALNDERWRGAMGGVSGIYYRAISAYAQDHGITGAEFDRFRLFLGALDGEYLAVEAEREKERQAERETKNTGS